MILTIKNRKPSVDFRSLSAGDFFLLDEELHMKLPSHPSHGPSAFRYSDESWYSGNPIVNDIDGGMLVEPVKLVEIIIERLN